MTFFELKNKIEDISKRFEQIKSKKDLAKLENQIIDLEKESQTSEFWSDQQKAQGVMQNLGDLKKEVEEVKSLESRVKDTVSLANEISESYTEMVELLESESEKLEKDLEKVELTTFLSGKFDHCNAILSIHAGQGGTEAMDWTSMLLRMYVRYCNSIGWKVEVLDQVTGAEAGLQSVSLEIKGRNAYGYLKHEHGTHRLVRISPFNAQGLRQTSFAGVEVTPVVEEDIDFEVKEEEIEFHAVRSSGAGGQNVNKVSSKVRLVHKPTGIAVESSAQRTQHQNRETALRMLKAKLYEIEEAKKNAELSKEKGEYKIAGWGNQIRNYVLQPYKLVKDLRTDIETSQSDSVLDGDLQQFIDAEVRML